MAPYLEIAEHLLFKKVMDNGFPFSGKSKAITGLLALSSALLMISIGYIIYACHIYFGIHYPSDIAPFMTAGVLTSFSLTLMAIAFVLLKYRERKIQSAQKEILDQGAILLKYVQDELEEPIKNAPLAAITLALSLGFLTSKRFL